MQLSGKIAGLAVCGQVWFCFHFASSLSLILEDCNFRMYKVGLALVCFSAFPVYAESAGFVQFSWPGSDL